MTTHMRRLTLSKILGLTALAALLSTPVVGLASFLTNDIPAISAFDRMQSDGATSSIAVPNRHGEYLRIADAGHDIPAGISSALLDNAPLPALGLSNPSLAMGLGGIADWSTQHPFIDIMKTARAWTGHLPNQWGGMTAFELENEGFLDSSGWPLSIPQRVTSLEALILTGQPEGATSLNARYRLSYLGKGEITLTGRDVGFRRSGRGNI